MTRRPDRDVARRDGRRTARVVALAVTTLCLALAPTIAPAQAVPGSGPGPAVTSTPSAQSRTVPAALSLWRSREVSGTRLTSQAGWFAEQARQEASALALAAARSARTAGGLVATVDVAAQKGLAAAEAAVLAATARVPAAPAPLEPVAVPAQLPATDPLAAPTLPRVDGLLPTAVADPAPEQGAAAVLAEAAALQDAASDLFAQAMAAETLVAQVSPVGSAESWAELGELEVALTSLDEISARLQGRPGPVAVAISRDASLDPWPNGAIPLTQLCAPDVAPGTWLRCDAADALDALNAAYRAEHGTDLGVTSGYRTLAEQALLRATLGSLAAPAGASQHGRGIAVDLADMGGLGRFDAPAYRWMKANGPLFGWHHPAIMEPGGGGPQEPWHWEFLPGQA